MGSVFPPPLSLLRLSDIYWVPSGQQELSWPVAEIRPPGQGLTLVEFSPGGRGQ